MSKKSLLSQLPAVEGKQGWPWTNEVSPEVYSNKKDWPKVSIVTPSFNQGVFLEETIRSILLQNYPNLEYIVIDGGSTDETLDVLLKYAPWITFWACENDKGQADAINKGISRCTGDIFNWINSDDFLAPGCLLNVGTAFKPGFTVAGNVYNFYDSDPDFKDIVKNQGLEIKTFLNFKSTFHQPGIWCDMKNIIAAGKFSIASSYYFDRIFFSGYFLKYPKITYIDEVLVHFRYHGESKTVAIKDSKIDELINYYRELMGNPLFVNCKKQISRGLQYQLIPEKYINTWEVKNGRRPFIKRLSTYISLSLKYPLLLKTRHFFTKLKNSVFYSLPETQNT